MKKMFDWVIKVGTTVLDTKKEMLAKLYKTENIDIPLDRFVIYFRFCLQHLYEKLLSSLIIS